MKLKSFLITLSIIISGATVFFCLQAYSSQESDSATTQESSTPNGVIVSDFYIPETLTIFGEEVPIHLYDVAESLDRELAVNVYFQSQTSQFLKYTHRYFPIIDSILIANNLHTDFKYLALAESGLRVNISPKGATGFWQLLEQTAKEYGLIVNDHVDQRYDIFKSTEAACKYLHKAYSRFESWTMVAASYNLGMYGLKQQSDFQNIDSYYNLYTNSETARYVFRIIALKLIMEQPKKYGYSVTKFADIPYSLLTVDTAIANLREFAELHESNYKLLKMLNPWLRDKHLPNSQHTPYKIMIVKNTDRDISKHIQHE